MWVTVIRQSLQARENTCLPMGIFMKEILVRIKLMAKEFLFKATNPIMDFGQIPSYWMRVNKSY